MTLAVYTGRKHSLRTLMLECVLLVAISHFNYAQSSSAVLLPKKTLKENPGRRMNSGFDEIKPMLSPDGSRLYFARKNSPDNIGGILDPQDIWIYNLQDDRSRGMARNLGPSFNSPLADNLCGIINDTTFVFYKAVGKKGFFEKRTMLRDGIIRIENFGPVVSNESHFLEGYLSPDGHILLFTARSRNNVAYTRCGDERDIYVSIKTSTGWTIPKNLGNIINSGEDEFSPFLAADGRTLFFASKRSDSFGDADIYYAQRTGPGWTNWTAPTNMGPTVNTRFFDAYLTLDPRNLNAYFVTRGDGYGKGDIMKVPIADTLFSNVADMSYAVGDTLGFEHLLFEKGKAQLKSSFLPDLEDLCAAMKANPRMEIEVHGHTDSNGSVSSLRKLSAKRVETIKDYLVARGIDGKRIGEKKFGGVKPVAKNNSEAGRSLNRRVELIIVRM